MILLLTSSEAAMHTFWDTFLKNTRTDDSDDVPTSPWEVALNDNNEPFTDEVVAASDDKPHAGN